VLSGELTFSDAGDGRTWDGMKASLGLLPVNPFAQSGVKPKELPPFKLWRLFELGLAMFAFDGAKRASVTGVLPAKQLGTWGPTLLATFFSAAGYGAKGHLWMLSPSGTPRGVIVDVAGNEAKLRMAKVADHEAAQSDERHQEAVATFGRHLAKY